MSLSMPQDQSPPPLAGAGAARRPGASRLGIRVADVLCVFAFLCHLFLIFF